VTANARDWTSLAVRRGTADLATERGTVTVHVDQEAVVSQLEFGNGQRVGLG